MRYKNNHSSSQPLVSVVIPSYNAEKYLALSINSLLSQTYPNLEIIIVNDGSTDSTLSILSSLAQKDSRIKIYSNSTNRNISHSLNLGISKAKGAYIARMDADDIAHKHRISQQISFLLSHPEVVIVGSQCKTINTQGKIIGRKTFPTTHQAILEALYTGNPIQHPSAMINRSLLPTNFSWYNPALPPAEDLDLFFRLGQFGQYANLPTFLLKYRQHIGSSTFKNPVHTFSLTRKVRALAVKKYGYRPTQKAKFINLLQILTVHLLPESFIYPLYLLIRGISSPFPSLMLNLNRGQKHHQAKASLSSTAAKILN